MRKLAMLIGTLALLVAGAVHADEMAAAPVDEATKAKVRQEIERYIAEDVALKKYFLMVDPRSSRALRLTLDHVHDEVMMHPKGGYAACVDFKDAAGKVYDVDLVVDASTEQPKIREISLHKADGKAVAPKSMKDQGSKAK